jgi:hypothetical protein
MIRMTIFDNGLRANEFTPNAVVTLEDLTGRVQTSQQALDGERNGIALSGRVS